MTTSSDRRIERLEPSDSGVFLITTKAYTRHLLDLDRRTITRFPGPGQSWSVAFDAPSPALADYLAIPFTNFRSCLLGAKMHVSLPGQEWRRTAEIRHIQHFHPPVAWDRQGAPIDPVSSADLFENTSYLIVADDRLEEVRVVTLWFGFDHSFGEASRPLIFGSDAVPSGEFLSFGRARLAATETEALALHEALMNRPPTSKEMRRV